MTTKTRLMLPTRTAKAFKPLLEVLAELESGKALSNERKERLGQWLTGLGVYSIHQKEKEKSGEEMYLPRLEDSTKIAESIALKVETLSKTYEPLKEMIGVSNDIAKMLKEVCISYRQRAPREFAPAPERVITPTKVSVISEIQVKTVGNAIQIGNLVFHDRALALEILNKRVG